MYKNQNKKIDINVVLLFGVPFVINQIITFIEGYLFGFIIKMILSTQIGEDLNNLFSITEFIKEQSPLFFGVLLVFLNIVMQINLLKTIFK